MIDLATSLRFGRGGNGIAWLRRGWSKPEADYVWSIGTSSTVTVPLLPAPGRVFLELEVRPFVHPPAVPSQRLDVVVNGTVLLERRLAWQCTLRVEVPASLRRQPGLLVELRHPDAAVPAKLGIGTDPRLLAVRLFLVNVVKIDPRAERPPPSGPAVLEATHRFGGNEDTGRLLAEGWGVPEIDYVWAVGRRSVLRLDLPAGAGKHRVLLDMQPFIDPHTVPRQRIAIGADDHLLGFVSLENRGCFAFDLPSRASAGTVTLSFDNMDAAERDFGLCDDGRPFAFMLCGVRLLRVPEAETETAPLRRLDLPGNFADGTLQAALGRVTGETAETIAAGFQSLGNGCELGLLQEKLGYTRNYLLRYAGIMTPRLVEGIFEGFWGLGRRDKLYAEIHPESDGSYWVVDDPYTLSLQTSYKARATSEDTLMQLMAKQMPFLARMFCEDIALAEKIFVFQRRDITTRPEADAVLAALSVWGDATLLWVQQDAALAGGVERLSRRLLRGFVDFEGTGGVGSDESWMRMLAAAWVEARGLASSASN